MRTLIRTFSAVPKVSAIEGFHCKCMYSPVIIRTHVDMKEIITPVIDLHVDKELGHVTVT